MTDSKVLEIANATGFNAVWEEIENAPNNGRYLDNLELHWLIARNAEVSGGIEAAEAEARAHSFESVAHMFTSVKDQALEDLDTRAFDW